MNKIHNHHITKWDTLSDSCGNMCCVLFLTVTGKRRRQFVTLKICTHSEGPPPAMWCAHPPSATTTHLNTGVSCGVSQSVISRGGASTDWVWGLCGTLWYFLLFSLSLFTFLLHSWSHGLVFSHWLACEWSISFLGSLVCTFSGNSSAHDI